jgi:hypothetical protein
MFNLSMWNTIVKFRNILFLYFLLLRSGTFLLNFVERTPGIFVTVSSPHRCMTKHGYSCCCRGRTSIIWKLLLQRGIRGTPSGYSVGHSESLLRCWQLATTMTCLPVLVILLWKAWNKTCDNKSPLVVSTLKSSLNYTSVWCNCISYTSDEKIKLLFFIKRSTWSVES